MSEQFEPYQLPRLSDEEMVAQSRAFFDEMNTRRSVRVFSPDPIPLEAVRNCIDTAASVARYQAKVSGPLLDRMDLIVPVVPVPPEQLADSAPGENSAVVRTRVTTARARQRARLADTPYVCNAQVPAHGDTLDRLCPLTDDARAILLKVATHRGLSPRAQHRLRRVAATLADLRAPAEADVHTPLQPRHILAAAQLRRPLDAAA